MNKIYIYMLEQAIPWEGEDVSGILYSWIHYTEDKILELIKDINEKIDDFDTWRDNKQIFIELEKYEIYPVSPIVIDGYSTGVDLPYTFDNDEYVNLDKLKGG